jgi:hypothetical protein
MANNHRTQRFYDCSCIVEPGAATIQDRHAGGVVLGQHVTSFDEAYDTLRMQVFSQMGHSLVL